MTYQYYYYDTHTPGVDCKNSEYAALRVLKLSVKIVYGRVGCAILVD